MAYDDGRQADPEDEENENRRDDVLEREFQRGSGRFEELWHERAREREESKRRGDILFSEYLADRRKAREREDENVGERASNRERFEVSRDDRDDLRFRDAAIHSTAIASLEGEVATVGDEEEENVPDEEHPSGADAKG